MCDSKPTACYVLPSTHAIFGINKFCTVAIVLEVKVAPVNPENVLRLFLNLGIVIAHVAEGNVADVSTASDHYLELAKEDVKLLRTNQPSQLQLTEDSLKLQREGSEGLITACIT